ncbi:MAG: DegV family protein [Lachnospiraceae bacterium]|nr:DegV family protein [Lachnospiraceae bacterium]
MSDFVISTESTSDLPAEYVANHNLLYIPLTFTFDGVTILGEKENVDIKDFYNRMRGNELPKTMASNLDTLLSKFRTVLDQGKDLLHIAFSSGLSSSCNNAQIAAGMLKDEYPDRKIAVVDSLCASLGQGFFVDAAVRKHEAGCGFDELVTWLEENKLHICHMFTVDDLKYLKNGGRISRTTAIVGTLLNVKPVLHTDDEGHLVSLYNVRGRKKALIGLVDKMEENVGSYKNDHVFISHADSIEDAKFVGELVTKRFGISDIMYGDIGPVIGSHAGPGTIALFFFGEKR